MTELARWNLKVSKQLDIDLRVFLAERGGKKGDLSQFVERAVSRALLQQALEEVWNSNRDKDPAEIERVVAEEVAAFRSENPDFWNRDKWATAR